MRGLRGADLVVRHGRRRHRRLRAVGHRRRALGPQGQDPRRPRARPARRPGARDAAGHRLEPRRRAPRSRRWRRRSPSWLATGLTGVKVGFGKLGDANLGFEHDRDVAWMKAVREALGPSKRIMIDCGVRNKWTVPEAVARVRAFEEYDLDWIEEPLGAEDPHGYAQLRQATQTLIAYGEREYAAGRRAAAARHGHGRRRRPRPRPRRRHDRLRARLRPAGARQAPGQRALLVDGRRHRREPRHHVGQAGLQAARGAAVQGPDAGRPDRRRDRPQGRLHGASRRAPASASRSTSRSSTATRSRADQDGIELRPTR